MMMNKANPQPQLKNVCKIYICPRITKVNEVANVSHIYYFENNV